MKNKKALSFLMTLGLSIAGCGCFVSCDANYKLTKKTVKFVNKSPNAFTISQKNVDFYYLNNSDVPYVDVVSFINMLDGFFYGNFFVFIVFT